MKNESLHLKKMWLAALFACLNIYAFAQCAYSGEVVNGSANGDCGILIETTEGTLFEPVGNSFDLEIGQSITFSYDIELPSTCNAVSSIVLTCVEIVDTDCVNEVSVDLAAQCTGFYIPVCGCNGQTYINACQAENWYGVVEWVEGACPGAPVDCEASFIFGFLEEDKVVFYNNSQGYTHFSWDFGNGAASASAAMVIIDPFVAGTIVCLEVWNEEGCYDELCLTVSPDAPEEMCNNAACIWPGDANSDGMANNYDLLNIGMGLDAVGPARPFSPFPNAPLTWAPNYGLDWNAWIDVVNFKHLDSDGNGTIGESDIMAIEQNYVADTEFTASPTPGAPVIYVEFETDVVIIDELTPQLINISADLYIGRSNLPVTNLHGIALDLLYSKDFIHQSATVNINYNDNSFFGPAHNVLFFDKAIDINPGVGRLDIGLSQKSNPLGINGYGKIATVNFVVNSDIIDGLALPEVDFEITVEKIKMIDSDGKNMDFDLDPQNASLIFINDGVSGKDPIPLVKRLNVFPNPVQEELFVELEGLTPQYYELVNLFGQVATSNAMNKSTASFSVRSFSPGVYWLKVYTDEGVVSKKVVINSGG